MESSNNENGLCLLHILLMCSCMLVYLTNVSPVPRIIPGILNNVE